MCSQPKQKRKNKTKTNWRATIYSMHLRNPAQYHEMQSKSFTSSDLLKLPIGLLTRLFTFWISLAVFYSSLAFWCTHKHSPIFVYLIPIKIQIQTFYYACTQALHQSRKKHMRCLLLLLPPPPSLLYLIFFWLLGLATKYWYVLKNRLRVNKPIASNFMTTHVE